MAGTYLVLLPQGEHEGCSSVHFHHQHRKKYKDIVGHSDTFFKLLKNIILNMPIHFNHHSQGEEEPVEQYITSLYSLAKECQSEKLQMDLDLTLEKVKSIVRH